jgi:hypothetical protein
MISKLGLSRRDRRTLAGGLCAMALLLTIARGLPALCSWEADRTAEAHSAGQQLVSLRSGLSILSVLRDTLRARRARVVALDSTLLFGASPSAIAADLALALENLADDNALKVTAMQLRSDTVVTAGLARVEVRITGITDVTGLAGFVRAVEAGAIPLVVRDLSVSQPEPAASDAKPEALRVEVLVASIGEIKSGKPEAHQ